jgi:hypothetical protein
MVRSALYAKPDGENISALPPRDLKEPARIFWSAALLRRFRCHPIAEKAENAERRTLNIELRAAFGV